MLGLTGFNHLQYLFAALAASVSCALLGFLIGAVSSNQITGVAVIKAAMLLVMGTSVAALVVPDACRPALWWMPPYWTFTNFLEILQREATWGTVGWQVLWNLASSVGIGALCYPWLRGKLDFARN